MNFFRGWEAYRDGFGKLTGEHWLGEPPHARPGGGLPSPCVPRPVTSEPRPHMDAVQASLVLRAEGVSLSSVKELHEHETKGGALAGWGVGCVSRRDVCFSCRGRPGTWSLSRIRQLWPVQGHCSRCWRTRTTPVLPCAWGSALPDAVLWTPRAHLPKERPVGAPGHSSHGPGAGTYSLPGTK